MAKHSKVTVTLIVGLTVLGLLFNPLLLIADPIPPLPTPSTDQYEYVATNDPDVISVANYAVQQIKRGSLFKIISAQKLQGTDITYFVVLDLVDAHVKHHHYSVEVLIPNDGSDWQIVTFSAVNY